MCGIVGYVGGKAALDVVVEGLRRLEYRGYDSAGVAIVADETLYVAKKAGKLGNLEKLLAEEQLPRSGLGIGHTRWATHGGPNDVNAHPHTSADGRIALVHNGIIENFVTLRAELEAAGIRCVSETDTEIVAQLLGRQVTAGVPLAEAMQTVSGCWLSTATRVKAPRSRRHTVRMASASGTPAVTCRPSSCATISVSVSDTHRMPAASSSSRSVT